VKRSKNNPKKAIDKIKNRFSLYIGRKYLFFIKISSFQVKMKADYIISIDLESTAQRRAKKRKRENGEISQQYSRAGD
jgi:hypothetical protein